MAAKARKIAAGIVGFLFVALLSGVLALQSSKVQTLIGSKLMTRFTENLDARVSFDSFKVLPTGTLVIKNLRIIDSNPYIDHDLERAHPPVDTMFRARTVAATFTLKGILDQEGIHLRRLSLDSACFHLTDNPIGPKKSNIQRVFNLPFAKEVPEETGNIFDIRKVRATDIEYYMTLYRATDDWSKPGLHMSNLHVNAPVIEGHAVKFTKGRLHAVLDKMKWSEANTGLEIREMTGRCVVGMGRTLVEDFHIKDDWSEINFDVYTMDYRNAYAFRQFVDEVKIGCTFGKSVVSAKTIAILTGGLKESDLLTDISSCRVDGFINDFSIKDMVMHDRPSGVDLSLDVSAKGILNPKTAQLTANIRELRGTTEELGHLVGGICAKKLPLEKYARGERFLIKAYATGVPDKFGASCDVSSPGFGHLLAAAAVSKLVSRPDSLTVSGRVETNNADISLFTGSDLLRQLTFSTNVNAVLAKDDPHVIISSLDIDRINFLGNDYGSITADGSLSDGTVTAAIKSGDPKLKLELDGRYDLKPHRGHSTYKLEGDILKADLKAIGLDKREGPSQASAHVFADFMGSFGTLLGDAEISDVKLVNQAGAQDIGTIMVGAHMYEGRQGLNLSSDFADASYTGSRPVTELVADIKRLILPQALPSLYKSDGNEDRGCGDYEIGLNFHDSRKLMAFVMPGVYIADSTRVSIAVDSGSLSGGISSPRLAFGDKNIKDADIIFDNGSGALNAAVSGSRFSAGRLSLSNPVISASASDDDIMLAAHYDGVSDTKDNGEINLEALLMRDSTDTLAVRIRTMDSFVKIGGEVWDLNDAEISLRSDNIIVDRFAVTSGGQSLALEGGMARTAVDTLRMRVENLDLAILDELLPREYGIEGIADGRAFLRSPFGDELGLAMNLGCKDLKIDGTDAGSVKMAGEWDDKAKRLGVSLSNAVQGREALYAHLSYAPQTKDIEANARLDDLSLKTAEPFLSQIFSEVDGSVRGEIDAEGKVGDLRIHSRDVNLDDVLLKVAYTGVPYSLNGPVRINSDGVFLDGVRITDSSYGSGTLKGELRHTQLKDLRLDANVSIDNLLVLDNPATDGDGPYGLVRASGNASLKGPFDALQIDANVATAGEGDVHIGVSGALSSNNSGTLLTFAEREKPTDPYDEMLKSLTPEKKKASDLSARAKVSVNPGLNAYVEIDKENGNVVSFNGSGNVNLDIRTAKDVFDLNGDYRINEGNYTFVIPGILKRNFVIQNGSSVKFSGDLMDSDLDIETLYKLKTSLSTLIADSTVVATRRLVECGIGISGKLNNPQIGLSIDVPDLDPTTRSMVESALNTEDKVQKQFVALLLMGSFMPNETSGIFNGTNMLYSNAADIFSNQLSNILQKLEIPLDLGFDYQGAQSGASIFDVAISTELFNNRVVVNGSVGNRHYSTSSNPNGDMVGDLDIDIKLDQPGNVRLSLFSHSADEYTSYLDYSQRNGVGLSYQKEYDKFGEFLRSLFTSKAKRQQKTASEPEEAKDDIIIKIYDEQR